MFILRIGAEHFTPTGSGQHRHGPAHVILIPHSSGLELAWVGISDPVTPESSISGRKHRRLRVTLCRLNTALSSEPRWVGGAVSGRGCRWQLTRRGGTDTGGGCRDVDGIQR